MLHRNTAQWVLGGPAMSTFSTSFPASVGADRSVGATPSSSPGAGTWFTRAGRAIWRALEDSGRARARRDLFDLAERYDAQQPEFAKELRAAGQRVTQA